ncbi:MAG: hypothetical protein M0R33_17215 [Methylomonas sp.]|uniref:hypothetical protein n=1 Tax=Methylomonas sp. TaxID=418 RepID=UPI0025FD147C|nr:hypothetical protein [Methylomonas sp.]MCK9608187.1 hypothetical protein [Methylomonas sp.]
MDHRIIHEVPITGRAEGNLICVTEGASISQIFPRELRVYCANDEVDPSGSARLEVEILDEVAEGKKISIGKLIVEGFSCRKNHESVYKFDAMPFTKFADMRWFTITLANSRKTDGFEFVFVFDEYYPNEERRAIYEARGQLKTAATYGSREDCITAKNNGATNFDEMLRCAAKSGEREICTLAKEWGATDFEGVLHYAAFRGDLDLCVLAKEWGANCFDDMICSAAEGGHKNLCILAKEWGAAYFDEMILGAFQYKHRDIINLAKEWGFDCDYLERNI